jgi:hypothetical protein
MALVLPEGREVADGFEESGKLEFIIKRTIIRIQDEKLSFLNRSDEGLP